MRMPNQMQPQNITPLFGIFGGMGPLASTEYVNSIYRYCSGKFNNEQEYPRIVLMSDPDIPDRTQAFKEKNIHHVIDALENKISTLNHLGVRHIIVACITAHLYLTMLNTQTQSNIVSLIKLLNDELNKQAQPSLILSSKAVYDHKLIENKWAKYLESEDATKIHELIYQLKLANSTENKLAFIDFTYTLQEKYQIRSMVFACTELHLVNAYIQQQKITVPYTLLDPLELSAHYLINKHLMHQENHAKIRNFSVEHSWQ